MTARYSSRNEGVRDHYYSRCAAAAVPAIITMSDKYIIEKESGGKRGYAPRYGP